MSGVIAGDVGGGVQCRMDREMLKQRLIAAEEFATLGGRHVAQQRELVAKLERRGFDTTEARRLLATFEELQAEHLTTCDRLRRELDAQSR